MSINSELKKEGYITRPEAGCALITRDGQEFPLRAQGWNAFPDHSQAPESAQ